MSNLVNGHELNTRVPLITSKNARVTAHCKWMFVVTRFFSITVNGLDAKKSAGNDGNDWCFFVIRTECMFGKHLICLYLMNVSEIIHKISIL